MLVCCYMSIYLILLVPHMCLYVLYLNFRYMHIHVNMNSQPEVFHICLYLLVSACMWKQIWNCVHAHMIRYSSSICLYLLVFQHYIQLHMIWYETHICLYMTVSWSACICLYILLYTLVSTDQCSQPLLQRSSCSTFAVLPLHVRS